VTSHITVDSAGDAAPVVSLSLSMRPSRSRRYNSGTDSPAKISRAACYWHFLMYHVSIVLAFGSLHRFDVEENILLLVNSLTLGFHTLMSLISFSVLNFNQCYRCIMKQNLAVVTVACEMQ